jgi:hypothetical protein
MLDSVDGTHICVREVKKVFHFLHIFLNQNKKKKLDCKKNT